jgi:hypothetical protein
VCSSAAVLANCKLAGWLAGPQTLAHGTRDTGHRGLHTVCRPTGLTISISAHTGLIMGPAGAEFSICPGDKRKSRLYATTALCCGLSAESAFAAYSRDFG